MRSNRSKTTSSGEALRDGIVETTRIWGESFRIEAFFHGCASSPFTCKEESPGTKNACDLVHEGGIVLDLRRLRISQNQSRAVANGQSLKFTNSHRNGSRVDKINTGVMEPQPSIDVVHFKINVVGRVHCRDRD